MVLYSINGLAESEHRIPASFVPAMTLFKIFVDEVAPRQWMPFDALPPPLMVKPEIVASITLFAVTISPLSAVTVVLSAPAPYKSLPVGETNTFSAK